jgi:HK97 gp10 family phage protein
MEDFDVEVTGLSELAEKLDRIPYNFAQKIQRAGLKAAGEVFAAEVEARAPVAAEASHPESDPGELKDSIGVFVRLGKDLDTSVVKVGPKFDKSKFNGKNRTHSPGIYGKFVEFGTRLKAAQPFMRPAFQAGKDKAIEAYAKVVESLLGLLVDGGQGQGDKS